jgi:hypothetical protein
MNSLRIAQDFLSSFSLSLALLNASSLCAQRIAWRAGRFLWGLMTTVISITIVFLSCWFLLYALMEWTQERQRKSGAMSRADGEINHKEHWNQRVVHLRSKEGL